MRLTTGLAVTLIVLFSSLATVPGTSAETTFLNVDLRRNSGADPQQAGVPLPLTAGTWRISVRDDPKNIYDGWTQDPATNSWFWTVRVTVPDVYDFLSWAPTGNRSYATQQDALDANIGASLILTLDEAATAYFSFLPC